MSYVEDVIRQLNQGATPAPRYTYDFKLAAVEQVKGGKTVHFVANTLGVAWDTLNSWVKAEKAGKLEGPPTEEISKMQESLQRLQQTVSRLQNENELLRNVMEKITRPSN